MDQLCSFHSVYTETQRQLIDGEFQRLKDEYFLDHAGGTLYSERQVEHMTSQLKKSILSNPHGGNIPSQKTEDAIDILRFRILQHFSTNSEEYAVIFTSNTTASLKLIAENFDFNHDNGNLGVLTYLEDNHTSVLGMRTYSETTKCISVDEAFKILRSPYEEIDHNVVNTSSLFIYPAQCNFSGTKYPLDWIDSVQRCQLNSIEGLNSRKWYVLVDAANYVGTNDLDLSKYKPDFITFSFYKIFGYPTGVGALLVRRESSEVLHKKYYGGGTVLMALSRENEAVLKNSFTERFEDGTLPYLSIFSLNEGFNTLSRLNLSMQLISNHTFHLAKYLFINLLTLHHSNGRPAVVLHHDTTFEDIRHQGAIVNFNLIRENGQMIGYSEVMNMSSLHKIHIRTGCCCNPGACQRHLKLTSNDVRQHFRAGHVCGDQNDLVDGVPTGSVRVSFGYMSRKEDADALLTMITDCFVQKPVIRRLPDNWVELQENYKNKFMYKETKKNEERTNVSKNLEMNKEIIMRIESMSIESSIGEPVRGILKYVLLYPVKSCGAFNAPKSWKVSQSGLEYDRKWMIVNSNGSCLSQKQEPKMSLIKPFIDLKHMTLELRFPGEEPITLSLHDPTRVTVNQCESKICRDKVIGYDCGDEVSLWLSKCLGCEGLRLIQQTEHDIARVNRKGQCLQLSFVNESQYLMINLASVRWLRDRVKEKEEAYQESLESMALRFRPNIVVDFNLPFIENKLDMILINTLNFKTVGGCTRCQMICINQLNAQKTREPLITLAREFGGKVKFGVYLRNEGSIGSKDTLVLESVVMAKERVEGGENSAG